MIDQHYLAQERASVVQSQTTHVNITKRAKVRIDKMIDRIKQKLARLDKNVYVPIVHKDVIVPPHITTAVSVAGTEVDKAIVNDWISTAITTSTVATTAKDEHTIKEGYNMSEFKEVIRGDPIYTTTYIQDSPTVIERVHIVPIVNKEIHMRDVIHKDIVHEMPIIEREYKDKIVEQREIIRDDTIIVGATSQDIPVQTSVVKEGTSIQTVIVQEEPVLVHEIFHDRPIIDKQIYQRDIITKDITHERPVIEKHLIENITNQSEVIKHPTLINQTVLVDKSIEKNLFRHV